MGVGGVGKGESERLSARVRTRDKDRVSEKAIERLSVTLCVCLKEQVIEKPTEGKSDDPLLGHQPLRAGDD